MEQRMHRSLFYNGVICTSNQACLTRFLFIWHPVNTVRSTRRNTMRSFIHPGRIRDNATANKVRVSNIVSGAPPCRPSKGPCPNGKKTTGAMHPAPISGLIGIATNNPVRDRSRTGFNKICRHRVVRVQTFPAKPTVCSSTWACTAVSVRKMGPRRGLAS
jgi:hypothetical protein